MDNSKRVAAQVHHLKTIDPYFSQVYVGLKNFELRKNDRDFKVGDILVLEEYDIKTETYTGSAVQKVVTMVLEDCPHFGLMPGYCILSMIDYKPQFG